MSNSVIIRQELKEETLGKNEDLDLYTDVKLGSNKSFGYVFTTVFATIGIWPLFFGEFPNYIFLLLSFLLLIITIFFAELLFPFNKLWFKFGLLLNKIVSPIIMGFLYFATFVPMGLLMRIFKKDPLKLNKKSGINSYWVYRDPPGPSSKSLKNQY